MAACEDGNSCVWDIITRTFVCSYQQDSSVKSIHCRENSSKIVTGSGNGKVSIWDINIKSYLRVYKMRPSTEVNSITWSEENKMFALGCEDGSLHLYKNNQPTPSKSFKRAQAIRNITLRALEKYHLLVTESNGKVHLLDVRKNKPLKILIPKESVNYVADCSTSHLIAASGDNGVIYIWDPRMHSKSKVVCLKGHEGAVSTLKFTKDMQVISGGDDGTIRTWSFAKAQQVGYFSDEKLGAIESLAISPDEEHMAVASGKKVILWSKDQSNTFAWSCNRIYRGHQAKVHCVAFLPNSLIASAGEDKDIHIFELDETATPIIFSGHTNTIVDLTTSSEASYESFNEIEIASANNDSTVRFWKIK
ncbi:MAG: hypothetical protein AAF335_04975 [Bacteroidota bacterium]